jgi:hypothetical protein
MSANTSEAQASRGRGLSLPNGTYKQYRPENRPNGQGVTQAVTGVTHPDNSLEALLAVLLRLR